MCLAHSEGARVTFAQIKNPVDDLPDGWDDEATFMATNLSSLVSGSPVQSVFGKKDLSEIKVLDNEDAYRHLLKRVKKEGVHPNQIRFRFTRKPDA